MDIACSLSNCKLTCREFDKSYAYVTEKLRERPKKGKASTEDNKKIKEILAREEKKVSEVKKCGDELCANGDKLLTEISKVFESRKKLNNMMASIETKFTQKFPEYKYEEGRDTSNDSSFLGSEENNSPNVPSLCDTPSPYQANTYLSVPTKVGTAKKVVQQSDMPDWAAGGAKVSFTPGLFPRGTSSSIPSAAKKSKQLQF